MVDFLFSVWWITGLVGLWVFCIFKLIKNTKKLFEKKFDLGTFIKAWFLLGLFLYLPCLIFYKISDQGFVPGFASLRVSTTVEKDDQGRVVTKKITHFGSGKIEAVEITE